MIEMLNLDLSTLSLAFAREDIKKKNYKETIAPNRKTVCCLTTEVDEFQEIPCDNESL